MIATFQIAYWTCRLTPERKKWSISMDCNCCCPANHLSFCCHKEEMECPYETWMWRLQPETKGSKGKPTIAQKSARCITKSTVSLFGKAQIDKHGHGSIGGWKGLKCLLRLATQYSQSPSWQNWLNWKHTSLNSLLRAHLSCVIEKGRHVCPPTRAERSQSSATSSAISSSSTPSFMSIWLI